MGKNLSQGSAPSQPERAIHVVEQDRPEVNATEDFLGHNSIVRTVKIHSDLIHKEHEDQKNALNSTKHLLNPNMHDQLYEEETIIEEAEGREVRGMTHD